MADQINRLAGVVLARIRPKRRYRDDCFQEAHLAGLLAVRSAIEAEKRISSAMLLLAMQQAVYRFLNKPKVATESDLGPDAFQNL